MVVVDIGTTTTALAPVVGGRLGTPIRLPTAGARTAGEWADLLEALRLASASSVPVAAVGVASVVPGAAAALVAAGRRTGVAPVELTGASWPLPVGYDDPGELGADRVANALGALDRYGAPVIVVDLGTATTLEVVAADGTLAGGAIAPGIGVGLDALRLRAPHLPAIPLTPPGPGDPAVATTAAGALRSGVLWGAGALVDGLVRRARGLVGPCPVVATGAGAAVAAAAAASVTAVDRDLTLWGVYRAVVAAGQCRPSSQARIGS